MWIVSFFGLPWLYPKTWFITTTEAFANTDLCGPSHAAFICLGFWFFWLLPYLYVFSKFQIFDPFRIQFKLQIQVLSILVLGSVYIVNISLTKQLLANRDLKLFEIGLLLLFFTTLWVMESVVPLYMLHRGSKDPLQGEALLQPPLAEILAFNPTLEMFEDFLLSEWSPENLAFYKEVVKYESTAQKVADWVEKKGEKAVDYLCKKAIRIYETYVAINSEQQVNLSDRVAEPLHKFFRRPHMLKLAKDAHIAATGPSKGNLEMVTPISRVASQFSLNSASRSPISTTRKKINEKKTSGVHTLEEKASNAKTRIQRQHSLDKCDKQDANKTKVNHFGLSRSPVRHPDRTMQRSHSFTMAVAQLSNTKFSSVKRYIFRFICSGALPAANIKADTGTHAHAHTHTHIKNRGSAEVITAMYVFIDAKEEAFQLMQKDSYMRFLALPQTQSILRQSCISSRRPQNVQKRSLKNSFSLSRSQSKVDIGNPRHEIFSATETDTRTSGSNIICATTRDSKSTLRDSNTRVKRESKAGNTSNTKLPRTSSSHVDGFRDINMSVVTVGTAAHESLQSSYVRRSSALEMLPFFALHGKQNPSLIVSKLTSPTAQHSEKSFGRQSQSQFRSSSISISHLSHSNPNPSNPTCLRVSPSSQRQKKVPIATPVSEAKKFLSSGGKTHDRHNHRQCY